MINTDLLTDDEHKRRYYYYCGIRRDCFAIMAPALVVVVVIIVVSVVLSTTRRGRHENKAAVFFGLGQVEFGDINIPFSYFQVQNNMRIIVMDDVLKYYQRSGRHLVGHNGGDDCDDALVVCFHGQADRAGRIVQDDTTSSSTSVYDTPAVQFTIRVLPAESAFTMVLNGETFSSDSGNVFLVQTLYTYSVQQIWINLVNTDANNSIEDDEDEKFAQMLQQSNAVYEFALVASEANGQWDEINEYQNRRA